VNTDVLADLSIANFSELRDTVGRRSMTARKRVFQLAHRVLGPRAAPLYTLVSHTTTPYSECVQIAARRERVARLLGADIAVAAMVATGGVRQALSKRLPGSSRVEKVLTASGTVDTATVDELLDAAELDAADAAAAAGAGAALDTPADVVQLYGSPAVLA